MLAMWASVIHADREKASVPNSKSLDETLKACVQAAAI